VSKDQRSTPSDIEMRVMLALDKLKLSYVFQYSIAGGSTIRGGILVDFVVSNPFSVPVEVFGDYWHESDLDSEDRMRLSRIEEYFNREVVILWGNELKTQEDADRKVREELA